MISNLSLIYMNIDNIIEEIIDNYSYNKENIRTKIRK